MDYMEKAWEASLKIVSAYEEDKYTDKDGLVWLGIEGETHDEDHWLREDALVSMSSADMMKKMVKELNGWDETPVEDPYEYALQTSNEHGMFFSVQEGDWGTHEQALKYLENYNRLDSWAGYAAKIVKRRKAGPVEDV